LILVVDDHADTRRMMCRLLQREGYAVESVESGMDAIHVAQERHPDLILLDLMMPDMNGLQVLKELRTQPQSSDIPVIMLTGSSDRNHIQEAKQLHVNAFYTKAHFRMNDLLAQIKTYADKLA